MNDNWVKEELPCIIILVLLVLFIACVLMYLGSQGIIKNF